MISRLKLIGDVRHDGAGLDEAHRATACLASLLVELERSNDDFCGQAKMFRYRFCSLSRIIVTSKILRCSAKTPRSVSTTPE